MPILVYNNGEIFAGYFGKSTTIYMYYNSYRVDEWLRWKPLKPT
jgi:hypothetical protein